LKKKENPIVKKIDVGAYYFPDFHPTDPRNIDVHGEGWSEWNLIKSALPRFPGHYQPLKPLWGYGDESDPQVMEMKIDAAAKYGIDYFLFDYYHYEDGTFLENCLKNGFLKAGNVDKIKFALMWANHDWTGNFPILRKCRPSTPLYPCKLDAASFERVCDYVIENYFMHPSYYKIDGKPYFSFFEVTNLLQGLGSVECCQDMLQGFREKVKKAGFPDVHLNTMIWGTDILSSNWGIARLPGEENCPNMPDRMDSLGFDSFTSYTMVHHVVCKERENDYLRAYENYFSYWDKADKAFTTPYFPNASIGWDPTPRAAMTETWTHELGGPFGGVIVNNTPERFEMVLRRIKEKMIKNNIRTMNINSWNEWTEGSVLEPEARYGYAYLEAVKRVFKDEA
jgi:hypothetical protein